MAFYSAENMSSLCLGVEASNIDLVRCSIDKTVDPSNIKYNDTSTLLHYAVSQNNVEIVKLLLSCTRDVNVTDVNGKTPLLVAVELNSEAYNKVQEQTDPESLKSYEQLVMQSQQIITLLLNAGADITLVDNIGQNPVFVAISNNNIPIIDCLLHKGLSMDPKTFAAVLRDSMHLATRLNNKEVVQILVENYSINVDVENFLGVTPLQIAIEMGNLEMMEYLLRRGASVQGMNLFSKSNDLEKSLDKSTDKNQSLDDSIAAEKRHLSKTMEYLLEVPTSDGTNSSPTLSIAEKLTPLLVAVQNNQLEMARLLLQHGADPELSSHDWNHCSPLVCAISRGYTEMTELLLRSGADPNERVNVKGVFSCYILHCAVFRGNLDVIKVLVDNGAKVNQYDKNGNTPLALAVSLHHHPIIDYFLNMGAFTNSLQSKVHPLHLAVIGNDLEAVEKLLQCGAELEAKDAHGKTALYVAVEKSNAMAVERLLCAGARVNDEFKCADLQSFTALHLATVRGNLLIVQMLLKHGARCRPENSVLHLAVATGNIELFNFFWANRVLIEGPDSNRYWSNDNTAIHWAIQHDQLPMVRLLHNLGINLNTPNEDGFSPLFSAMLRQNHAMVTCLIKDGALINEPCTNERYNKWLPIHLAAYFGNLDWLCLLVQYGASLHAINDEQQCPLWLAVKRGHFNAVKFLLKQRADVHCRNTSKYQRGDTPLHLAVQNRRIDLVKLLIQFKADVNRENDAHISPLALAVHENDLEITKYLLKKGGQIYANLPDTLPTPLLNIAVAKNQRTLVQLLLQHGASADDVDKMGKTPLALAIEYGHVKMVKYLLKHGADVNAAYRLNGQIIVRTLFLAISGNHLRIVKELIKHKVDVTAPMDNERHPPLAMAALLGYANIAETLLTVKNVDVDAVDANGMTALHHACANGHKDVIQLLVEYGASLQTVDKQGCTPGAYCKDESLQKLNKIYLTKQYCLKLSEKELAAYYVQNEDPAFGDLLDLCLNEFARMKTKSIVGITLYKLLIMSPEECQLFFRELTEAQMKKLARYLKADKAKAAYPNFVYMLRRKVMIPHD